MQEQFAVIFSYIWQTYENVYAKYKTMKSREKRCTFRNIFLHRRRKEEKKGWMVDVRKAKLARGHRDKGMRMKGKSVKNGGGRERAEGA